MSASLPPEDRTGPRRLPGGLRMVGGTGMAPPAPAPAPDSGLAPAAALPRPAYRRPPGTPAAAAAEPPAAAQGFADDAEPRFRIYVIDSGWHSTARKVLRENMNLLQDLTHGPVYLLDKTRSIACLRRHRAMIGRDPIIIVHDCLALKHRRDPDEAHGMRVHLGLLRKEQAVLAALQTLTNFLARFRQNDALEDEIRRKLRMEGLEGAIEIIAGRGPAHMRLEF